MALCRRARVPIVQKIDDEITQLASTDIIHIEVDFQKDEEKRASRKQVDTTPAVHIELLEADTLELTHEPGMPPSTNPTLSSPTLTPSSLIQAQL